MEILETHKLYNGEVLIEVCKDIAFGKEYQFYRKDGKKLFSSSKIAGVIDKSDILMWWASKECRTFLLDYINRSEVNQFTREELLPVIEEAVVQYKVSKEKAADKGTRVHDFAEQFAKSKLGLCEMPEIPEDDESVVNGINAFLDWYNKTNPEFEWTEKVIYSKKHNFGGRADAGAKISKSKKLIDHKTSSRIYPEHLLQVSSYYKAYTEEHGERSLNGALILHYNKDTGEFDTKELTKEQINTIYPYFLNCLELRKAEEVLKKI